MVKKQELSRELYEKLLTDKYAGWDNLSLDFIQRLCEYFVDIFPMLFDDSTYVKLSEYQELEDKYNILEDKYNILLDELQPKKS